MIRKILIVSMFVLALGQIYLYRKNINNIKSNKINTEECIYEENNVKNIKEINKDLKVFEKNEIVSYNKSENKWVIDMNLKGNKKEIEEALLKLKENYQINSYDLVYNNKIFNLKLEIQGK